MVQNLRVFLTSFLFFSFSTKLLLKMVLLYIVLYVYWKNGILGFWSLAMFLTLTCLFIWFVLIKNNRNKIVWTPLSYFVYWCPVLVWLTMCCCFNKICKKKSKVLKNHLIQKLSSLIFGEKTNLESLIFFLKCLKNIF